MSGEHPLIFLEGLSKVFYTEEVETHALSNINLSISTANRMAQAGALAAMADTTHLRRCVKINERGRRYLAKHLARLGIKLTPSWANFYLTDFSKSGRTGAEIYEYLLSRGIIVRPMDGYGLTRHVRISIGTPEQNQKLFAALGHLLLPGE